MSQIVECYSTLPPTLPSRSSSIGNLDTTLVSTYNFAGATRTSQVPTGVRVLANRPNNTEYIFLFAEDRRSRGELLAL